MTSHPIPAHVRVFTDGACQGNPGPGGWGWAAVDGGASCSGPEAQSTNQRMEVWAALDALTTFLEQTESTITIVSDSTYVVNCFKNKWYVGWKTRGWKNTAKQPVANQDLWKPFIELYLSHPGRVTFEWVKGHSGNPMNDLVDALAVAAAAGQYPRRLTDPFQWFAKPELAVAPGEGPDQQSMF